MDKIRYFPLRVLALFIAVFTILFFGKSGGAPQTASMPFPGTWSYAYEGQMAVIHINIEKNRDAMHEFIFGKAD